MTMLLHGTDLILWSIIAVLSLALLIAALAKLFRNDYRSARTELGWVVLIIFVPAAGPLFYLIHQTLSKRKALSINK